MLERQNRPILEVNELVKRFPKRSGLFSRSDDYKAAVDGVTFSIRAGEVLGLVGESGCGKTTLGKTILRLYKKDSGSVTFKGEEVFQWSKEALRARRHQMQMIFQHPDAALNPRMKVIDLVTEVVQLHDKSLSRKAARHRALHLLEEVQLHPDKRERFPHQLSGGEKRRVGIARILAANPEFIVADEPVSKLDVSLQGQIIDLMLRLRGERGLTYLYISHDLQMVQHISDRIAVMYLGKLVELASKSVIAKREAQHPYTRALLDSIITLDHIRPRGLLTRDLNTEMGIPSGCRFHPRCPQYLAMGEPHACRTDEPQPTWNHKGQMVACHYPYDMG